jgi:hypothetical protein
MEAPAHILESLRNVRSGFWLKWNPKAVLLEPGMFDGVGNLKAPKYDPRWELWDTDPDGRDYMVMRLQTEDGGFRAPGEWLVVHINRFNPEKYGGSVVKMLRALEGEAEALKEIGEKDFDDLAGAAANWCAWLNTPKSAAGLSFRGIRKFAPGM